MSKHDPERHKRHDRGKKDESGPTGGRDEAADAGVAEAPVRVVERGSFAVALCDCGWSGPGRRSRKRARADAEEHLAHKGPNHARK